MTLKQFIEKYNGKKVDFDKSYGAQCVDLYRQYCADVLEIDQTPSVEGAKDIWQKHGCLSQTDAPESGDILIYDKNAANQYGHVCILVAYFDYDTFIVFEQDGFKQDGAKLALRSAKNLLGGLHK